MVDIIIATLAAIIPINVFTILAFSSGIVYSVKYTSMPTIRKNTSKAPEKCNKNLNVPFLGKFILFFGISVLLLKSLLI